MRQHQRDDIVAELVRRRGDALVRFAYLLTGDVAAAQDLVQDALVKVFVRFRDRPDAELAEAYVRRAVVNLHIDDVRRRRHLAQLTHLVATPDSAAGPDAAASVDLHAALATLGPQERAAIVLRYFDDLTVPEIADEMGLAQGTVKRYLHNAIGRLEQRLGPMPSLRDAEPDALHVSTRGRS